MKSFLILAAGCLISLSTFAQSANHEFTTVYLVRHAEKKLESTPDPDLSEAGLARAESLVYVLKKVKFDAFYSTDYKRTRNTLQPLASKQKAEIQLYDAREMDKLAARIKSQIGKNVIISGHSNTLPDLLNYLIGAQEMPMMEDHEYGNLFVLTIHKSGSVGVQVLQY